MRIPQMSPYADDLYVANEIIINRKRPIQRGDYYSDEAYQEALENHLKNPPLINMRKLYKKLHNANGRYSQWMKRAIAAAIKAGVLKHGDFLRSKHPKYIRTLPIHFAMLLLAYGPNATYNRKLMERMAHYAGFPAPMTKRARAEEDFALQLQSLTEYLNETNRGTEFSLRQQVPISTYIVDFVLTVSKGYQTPVVVDKFVIEFDEEYHASVRQKRRDNKRDTELEAQGYKVIRLGKQSAEKWLGICSYICYPLHLASAIQKEINSLIKTHPRTGKRFVSPIHLEVTLEYLETIGAIESFSKQPLVDIGDFLSQHGVSWKRSRLQYQGKQMRVLVIEDEEDS